VPCHPSAWCKANQGWATVENITQNRLLRLDDVKNSHTVYRLWREGVSSTEYFLIENRQRDGFDTSLPGDGLLVWHIDDAVAANSNESHYKVALVQADGNRDLEKPASLGNQGGDAGDPYPGSAGKRSLTNTTQPNSRAYSGQSSGVSLTEISDPGATMSVRVRVRPGAAPTSQPPLPEIQRLTARIDALAHKIDQLAPAPQFEHFEQALGHAQRNDGNGDHAGNGNSVDVAGSGSGNLVREAARAGLRYQGN
jgi:hypothetical protein